MNAVDYLKEKGRMTKDCTIDCGDCPFVDDNNGTEDNCMNFESEHPEQAVEIVEKWAKKHPVKTYLSVLLEKLPNAKLNIRGIPDVCIKHYFGKEYGNCGFESCKDCWNREYKEE